MNEELNNIQTQLAAQQQQIVDAQQRLTALEAGRGPQAGGDLLGLFTTAMSVASRFARTAAEAHATQEKPAEEPPRRERRAGGLAAKLAELREDRPAEQPPRSLSFPVEDRSGGFYTDPAATYAGRTAPRRTLPPETPVRLWNAEHTDHHDAVGRAVAGVENTQVRIRPSQAEDTLAWLVPLIEPDDCGPVYVAWMDREWTLAGYSTSPLDLTVELLPIPKPPRVDEVLGRADRAMKDEIADFASTYGGKTTPTASAPYAGPFPDLAKGDRIGVEHDDGTITVHEFSGDPAHPVAGDSAAQLGAKLSAMRGALSAALDLDKAPEEYKLPDGVGLGTVPEYSDGACMGHCPAPPPHGTDVDEVLPMPGGPNDRLSHGAQAASDVARSAEWLREHPTAMHPETAQTIARHGYGDLYARLDAIHDATAEEDQ